MNPDDLLKAAPEIAKGAGALAAAVPFTGIVKRMLGPAADELAEMWRDQVRIYRYSRQVKLLEKVEKIAEEAGFVPEAVAPKILFPLLEGASFEDNEDLHDMWAALLANAASPESAEKIRPGFIAILKQMAPDEARLLIWLAEHDTSPRGISIFNLRSAERDLGYVPKGQINSSRRADPRFLTSLDGLEAQRLVERNYWNSSQSEHETKWAATSVNFTFSLTQRAKDFLMACQPPQPRA